MVDGCGGWWLWVVGGGVCNVQTYFNVQLDLGQAKKYNKD